MSKARESWGVVGSILFGAYLIIGGLHGIYFEWIYWNTHGPIAAFFFGAFVSGLKALIWPLWYLI